MTNHKICRACNKEFECTNRSILDNSKICGIFPEDDCRCVECFAKFYTDPHSKDFCECLLRCWKGTKHENEIAKYIVSIHL